MTKRPLEPGTRDCIHNTAFFLTFQWAKITVTDEDNTEKDSRFTYIVSYSNGEVSSVNMMLDGTMCTSIKLAYFVG